MTAKREEATISSSKTLYSVLITSTESRGFDPRWSKTKDYIN